MRYGKLSKIRPQMEELRRKIGRKLRYDQKKDWDTIACSYLKSHNPILDVGCGEGRFISLDPQSIIGIDWNPTSVESCERRGYNVIRGDIRALPFDDGYICGIHCSHVLEHFFPSDVHKTLKEFNRVLRKDGILVIRGPLLWTGFYSDLTHVRPYNPYAIINYLTPSGQRTLEHIAKSYEVLHLRWRYRPLWVGVRYLGTIGQSLNRWGFPWLQKNGYMLVMRKK